VSPACFLASIRSPWNLFDASFPTLYGLKETSIEPIVG
jgi:hypothetical protein